LALFPDWASSSAATTPRPAQNASTCAGSDIADSAHWYNRPEVGIVVWRGKDERTIVRIAKARYHDEIGVPGEVVVRYVREQSTFEAA
jgi:hypothetical protein